MKRYIIFMTFLFMFLNPTTVKAESCDYKKKARLQEYANNITYKVNYTKKEDGTLNGYAVALNVTDELYILSKEKNKKYYPNEEGKTILDDLKFGKTNIYYVYPKERNCNFSYKSSDLDLLEVKYIKMPYFNKYYKDDRCIDNEELNVCKMLTLGKITESRFLEGLKNKSTEVKPPPKKPEEETSFLDKLLNLFIKYYIYILPTVIVLGVAGIYLLKKESNYEF